MSAFRGMQWFMVIWLGQLISMIGSGLSSFALGVWLVQQTGQATPFALTVLCASLPPIVLSPLAGALADRWNRRRIMIMADTGSALVTLAAVALLSAGQLAAWHVYLIAALGAVCATFQEPAYRASVTMLVPKEQLARASALSQLSQAIEMLLVPLLAGLLFAAIGLRGVFVLDFISFFFAVGALLATKIPQPPAAQTGAEAAPRASLRGDIAFGWRYLRARPGLLLLIWYFALVNFLANFAAVLRTPLILGFGDARTLGIAQLASGLGLLGGSLALSVLAAPRRRVPAIIGAIAFSAVGLGLTGLRPSGALAAVGSFIFLLGIPLAAANSEALFQSKVAPAVQGRVFAMRTMVSRSMMPLAFLSSGLLADGFFNPLLRSGGGLAGTPLAGLIGVGEGRGVGLMFVLAAAVLLAVSGWAALHPRLRRLERDLPDHDAATPEAAPLPSAPAGADQLPQGMPAAS